ncbi:hypothetical protein MKK67_07930, partial [Methylobacterium sp. J-072]|nr:hypothetical protein [Methylobacterium sp. J-072]
NSSAVIAENSWPGRVLHALVGYTDRPTALQGLVYVGTIAVMVGLMQCPHRLDRRHQPLHDLGLAAGGRRDALEPLRQAVHVGLDIRRDDPEFV